MKMRLCLPANPLGISIFNAFVAAYSPCFHLVNIISGFIITNVFYKKIHLAIKTGLVFSFRPELQHTSETTISSILNIHYVVKLKV